MHIENPVGIKNHMKKPEKNLAPLGGIFKNKLKSHFPCRCDIHSKSVEHHKLVDFKISNYCERKPKVGGNKVILYF